MRQLNCRTRCSCSNLSKYLPRMEINWMRPLAMCWREVREIPLLYARDYAWETNINRESGLLLLKCASRVILFSSCLTSCFPINSTQQIFAEQSDKFSIDENGIVRVKTSPPPLSAVLFVVVSYSIELFPSLVAPRFSPTLTAFYVATSKRQNRAALISSSKNEKRNQ